MKIKSTIAAFALLGCLGLPLAHSAETLVLNSGAHAPLSTHQHNGVLDIVYQKLAERLGVTIQIQLLPAERALLNANAGIDDGDICRVPGLAKKYPNLLQVPEILMPIKLIVLSKNFTFKVKGFESLQPYRVGILIGRKLLEDKVTNVKSLTKFVTDKEIITALETNQIDIGIMEKSQAMYLIKRHPSLHALQPALHQDACHLYLNKKHAAWVPRIAEELKIMKQDGSLKKILHEGFRPYLNGETY